MQDILITAKSTIASVGHESDQIWKQYNSSNSALTTCCFNDQDTPTGKLTPASEGELTELRKAHLNYRRLDKSVLMALWASRNVVADAGWTESITAIPRISEGV